MPRNGSGVYSLPAIYQAVTGEPITAIQHNSPLTDIAADLNATRPIAAGGTGANTEAGARTALGLEIGSDVQAYDARLAPTPAGAIIIYAGASAPTGWLLCSGQAVSRATYAALYAAIGTTYGSGNGSTTFNVPDIRGRVVAGQDDMGGTSANRLTGQSGGVNGDTLGATGGAETHALTAVEGPSHTHGFSGTTSTDPGHSHGISTNNNDVSGRQGVRAGNTGTLGVTQNTEAAGSHSHTFSGTTGSSGSGAAHNNVQPTLILNYIIRT